MRYAGNYIASTSTDCYARTIITTNQHRHLLHSALTCPPSGNARHLKSRNPLLPSHNNHQFHLTTTTEVRSGRTIDGMWSGWTTLRDPVLSSPKSAPTPLGLPCQEQRGTSDLLNRLRTGVGRFCTRLQKWGMASSAACECGAEKQTVDHVVLRRPINRLPHGLHGLTVLDDVTSD